MRRKSGSKTLAVAGLIAVFGAMGIAQTAGRRPLITQALDESRLVRLAGNTRPEANIRNDLGLVSDDLQLDMILQLKRSPEQDLAAKEFVDSLTDKTSPNFHKWISAAEYGQRFGVAAEDIATVSRWLQSHGFTVNGVPSNNLMIAFSGTAGQVRQALRTEIHYLQVAGRRQFANMSDPQIPAALLPAVTGVVSLNNFKPRKMLRPKPLYTISSSYQAVAPSDLATIYNLSPAFAAGYTGQGQTIAVLEDTDLYDTADWDTFRSVFGLNRYSAGSLTQVHPAGTLACSAPGISSGSGGTDTEAAADVEWATAAAPGAAIVVAACADTATNFGGLIALQNMLSNGPLPGIVSISYGEAEVLAGTAFNSYINLLYQTAAAAGVSVFVSSGDSGAATVDAGSPEAIYGISVSGWASTPYNVAVGGTDFADYNFAVSHFWGNNDQYYGSAKSYIPEMPWNDTCGSGVTAGYLYSLGYINTPTTYGLNGLCNDSSYYFLTNTVAAGGGPSACVAGSPTVANATSGTCSGYVKPSWQSVYGNPSDGVRDIPDVALFAADGLWGHYYVTCFSDLANNGAPCTGAPSTWAGGGGTSFSAPIMAGIQALINQATGTKAGNPNPAYYQIAQSAYSTASGRSSCNSLSPSSACTFNDVTTGDITVPCAGTFNCFLSGQALGVLSTSSTSYEPAYAAASGWDFATGLGSVNAFNLLQAFTATIAPANLSVALTAGGAFTQGQSGATYTITVSSGTAATSGTVTVTAILPSGLTAVSMAGTGWSCASNACSRGDSLAASSNYPAITLTVDVAVNAVSPQQTIAVVAGGGAAAATATDSTVILPLAVPCSYTLNYGGQAFTAAGGTGTISVTAGSGCAWTASAPGSLTWVSITSGASEGGNGTVTYTVGANGGAARSGTLTVAGTSFTVQQAGAGAGSVAFAGSMAQVAAGGGWITTITLVNTGATAAEVVLNFYDNDGKPLPLPLIYPASSSTAALLAATFDQTLAAGAQLVLQTAAAPSDAAVVGWAQLLASGGNVGGNAVFAIAASTTQEAVVPIETRNPATAFVMPFNYTNGYATGVAVANVANLTVNVPMKLYDASGTLVPGSAQTVQLAPHGHTSFMLTEKYPNVSGYGTVEFGTAAGQISVVGIRATPALAVTTIPVLAQ